jgi:hypothetical protein
MYIILPPQTLRGSSVLVSGFPVGSSHTHAPPADWLRERVYFEGLMKKDQYAIGRLGYKAPNIFVMMLAS